MNQQDVQRIVLRHLHELVPGTQNTPIDLGTPLVELGADSLDLVDVASRSMQEMGVTIPRSEIGRIRTLGDLVDVLLRCWESANAQQAAV